MRIPIVPKLSVTIVLVMTTFVSLENPVIADQPIDSRDSPPPNVILIMADDLGFADLSCYGSELIKTPVLDQLASEGLRLTSYYAGCTVCTPSRMALLTGAYPARVGWRGGVVGHGINDAQGLSPEVVTIAEVFQSAGYATALFGKWHLGDEASMLPMNQGFDATFFITKSNNQTKKLYQGSELIQNPFDNRRLTEQFSAQASEFIEKNRTRPFFLYLPLTAPHFPAQSHPDWNGKSKLGAYGDVVEELDSRIGQILQTLKDHKLEKNTIVIFTSDNGPEPGQKQWARATPYRGLKWSSLEGGNRVPFIIRWPEVIPSGRISDDLVAAIDVLPTLADACGLNLAAIHSDSPVIDGLSVWQSLTNQSGNLHPRSELLTWSGRGVAQAIRVGNWKLYFDRIEELPQSSEGPVLINLANDPTESIDLSDKHSERVQEMKSLAIQRLAQIEANSLPLGGQAKQATPEIKRGFWLHPTPAGSQ